MIAHGDVDVVLVLALEKVELKRFALYAVILHGILTWT
jgi:hypothetical protein